MTTNPVPPAAIALLRRLDRAAPGLVERLYLTGSVALGIPPAGVNDVDFLAVSLPAGRHR